MRKTIFISHAAPEDNDFTRWLTLQLIGLGYTVWSDVFELKGGEDWWPLIEKEIRNNTIKFLVVLTKSSIDKDGVLKEIAVAQKVKKQLEDDLFIIPLHLDTALSYDDINVELIRLNSINFKKSWAEGLKMLLERLEEDNIPKGSGNYDEVRHLWDNMYLQNKKALAKTEIYSSNWFPIEELPKVLRFHRLKYAIPDGFDIRKLQYPATMFKNYLATFAWCYDFLSDLPKTTTYNQADTIEIPLEDILNGKSGDRIIDIREAKKIVVRLLNDGFIKSMNNKTVSKYQMSNKTSFWIKKGVLEKDKFKKIQLIGKQKEKYWHYGVSADVKLFPERCFVINSHIWFTYDGENLIPEAGKQHAARRKQGKNWWNNDWRNKTLAFMQFLADEDGYLKLKMGSDEFAKANVNPILFESPISYNDPNKDNLSEIDFYNDDIDDEIIPGVMEDVIE
ncbi:MAG TPA: hypothetical protein DCQ50_19755 [Chryseobacterium sp.]|nr:hypothetical protein [Chryseobacterium sp.]